MMFALIFVFRLVHILSAIFWVGTTLFSVFFLEPTIKALAKDGSRFMQQLIGSTRFSLVTGLAGFLTILSGFLMYGPVTGNFNFSVMFSSRLMLTLGALSGIVAGILGSAMQGRASGKLMALGQQITAQNGPPTNEQSSKMAALESVIQRGSRWSAVLMVLAVIGMVW